MAEQFVTVLKTWSVEEAHIERIRLANEGIEAILNDNQTVAMDWGLANAIHGVSLVVRQEDADRAREILSTRIAEDEVGDQTPVDGEPEVPDETDDGDDQASPGAMETMRSSGKLVILFYLIPVLVCVVLGVAVIVTDVLRRAMGNGSLFN
jgi:hypothetical protein